MSAPVTWLDSAQSEVPDENRYDLLVATEEFMTADEARKALPARVKLVNDEANPVNTVIMVHGYPEAVLVSVEEYREIRKHKGQPVTWQFPTPPRKRKTDEQSSSGERTDLQG